jgi:arylsulfatase A-like enzyme
VSDHRPNILFIMSDDHASHAMSCYGSRINCTPYLDRIVEGGMRFGNCFCTNMPTMGCAHIATSRSTTIATPWASRGHRRDVRARVGAV